MDLSLLGTTRHWGAGRTTSAGVVAEILSPFSVIHQSTMATVDPALQDPLLSLRRAIAANVLPTPTTTTDVALAEQEKTEDLAKATHLYFQNPIPHTIPLSAPTRFVSSSTDSAVDLRSIFFAWQKKDVAIPEYIASAQDLNEALSKLQGEPGEEKAPSVQNLIFVERLDLITWLEGASDESEHIKPLEGVEKEAAAAATAVGPGGVTAGDVAGPGGKVPGAGAGVSAPGATQHGRTTKVIDPRLQEIYNGERKMGDRNTVLRGMKPTDFSHVRKSAEIFLGRNRSRPGQYPAGVKPGKPSIIPPTPSAAGSLSSLSRKSKSSRNEEPIILLSPSASSLIRTSNAKSFLQDGIFVPPDHPTLASDPSNILKIERPLRILSSSSTAPASRSMFASGSAGLRHDMRFVLVDSTANFKPEYWNRVVAVFTTGQTWQFKSYKWTAPPELFKHATGIYVGWRGDDVPREVKGWGRGVTSFAVERWDDKGGVNGAGRWRDREVVEGIWTAIEEGMKLRGWGSK